MRQILIIKGKNDNKTAIVNLSPTHTYDIIFEIDKRINPALTSIMGDLRIMYAHATRIFRMRFADMEDAKEFEQALVEYMMNGSTPITVEEDKAEIRYWFEFEVLEIHNG